MYRGHDPLFSGQSALPSLPNYHQCATHVPPIFNFLKKITFSALFLAKISQEAKFLNFRSQDPSFFKENRSLDPNFGKPRGTY